MVAFLVPDDVVPHIDSNRREDTRALRESGSFETVAISSSRHPQGQTLETGELEGHGTDSRTNGRSESKMMRASNLAVPTAAHADLVSPSASLRALVLVEIDLHSIISGEAGNIQ